MRTAILIGLILVGLVTVAPGAAADPPPGYGTCHHNEDAAVWVEDHDGTPYVVVDPSWRPIECYW